MEHECYSDIANCRAKITAIFQVIFWILEAFKFIYLLIPRFSWNSQQHLAESWISVEPQFGNSAVQCGHSATSVFYCNLRRLRVSHLYVIAIGTGKSFSIYSIFSHKKINKPVAQHSVTNAFSHRLFLKKFIYCRQANTT